MTRKPLPHLDLPEAGPVTITRPDGTQTVVPALPAGPRTTKWRKATQDEVRQAVACPRCGAPPAEPCQGTRAVRKQNHEERWEAMREHVEGGVTQPQREALLPPSAVVVGEKRLDQREAHEHPRDNPAGTVIRKARFEGRCCVCARKIRVGQRYAWDPVTRERRHAGCR